MEEIGGAGTSYAGGGAGGGADNNARNGFHLISISANNENGLPGKMCWHDNGRVIGGYTYFGGGTMVIYGTKICGTGIFSSCGGTTASYDSSIGLWYHLSASGGGSINIFAQNFCDINSSQCTVTTINKSYPALKGGSGTINARYY